MNNSETISNMGKAHYLANLPNNYYKNNIFESDAIVEEGEKYDTETYLTQLKNWLQLVIQNKGNMKTKYNYSKNMKDCGRLYVQTFGIQKLERKIRGFLCNEDYIDIDMVNAHPTILLYIQQTYFKQLESPTLTKYVKSRSKYLTKYNFTKKDFLINMNKSDNYTGNNSFIKTAHQEIQKLQQAIFQSTEPIFCNVSKAKLTTTNTTARFLNRVLCYFENIILQEAVSTFDKSKLVYFFDGFFLSKKDVNSLSDIIEKLNKNKYNIKWSNKEHDTTIQIDPDYELPIYETPYEYTLLNLYSKNPSDWSVVDGAYGKIHYATTDFMFWGYELVPTTHYTLLTYGGWNDIDCFGTETTNVTGDMYLDGGYSFALKSDEPSVVPIKIWLVPSGDVDCNANKMLGWNPTSFIFEENP